MNTPVSHVLARKYRSQVFDDLIGQDALVRTITNAISSGRLAHAYMLTGIRGVGKTSSARIIAKGLNCIGPDGNGGMTPNPCGKCRHCIDIANDSHIDVIEIDAASNTGVDNVREIIEGAKYNPVSARFKIYIIDEVHMLSRQAFNALLKTLEEPPERIKFIFATTEIRKVPVTILSRCQRFDLRRVDEVVLKNHLAKITQLENAQAEDEALQLLARAGDGSVRDALSLLDQAITQFDGHISAEQIREMLGVADRTALFDLYEAIMKGAIADSLSLLNTQYECGADPLVIAQDLLELTHWLTRIKIVPDLLKDVTVPEAERVRGKTLAEGLSMAALTSVWQMLLKGIMEVKQADHPLKALEMLIIRMAYAADMPSPAQVIEDIKKNGITVNSKPVTAVNKPIAVDKTSAAPVQQPVQKTESVQVQEPSIKIENIADMTKLARSKKEMMLAFNLENHVRPIEVTPGKLICSFTDEAPDHLSMTISQFLTKETGIQWTVEMREKSNAMTQSEVKQEKKTQQLVEIKKDPLVASVLETFKGSKIEVVKPLVTQDFTDEPASEMDE